MRRASTAGDDGDIVCDSRDRARRVDDGRQQPATERGRGTDPGAVRRTSGQITLTASAPVDRIIVSVNTTGASSSRLTPFAVVGSYYEVRLGSPQTVVTLTCKARARSISSLRLARRRAARSVSASAVLRWPQYDRHLVGQIGSSELAGTSRVRSDPEGNRSPGRFQPGIPRIENNLEGTVSGNVPSPSASRSTCRNAPFRFTRHGAGDWQHDVGSVTGRRHLLWHHDSYRRALLVDEAVAPTLILVLGNGLTQCNVERRKHIGVLTGGGDAPGLNAVIRAVVKAACNAGMEVIGLEDSFDGLLDFQPTRAPDAEDVTGILRLGGTILGTTNRGNPFDYPDRRRRARRLLRPRVETFDKMGLDGLVVIGGDGTLAIAHQFYLKGMPVVGVPKTIDNDIWGPPAASASTPRCRSPPTPSTGCTRPPKRIGASWSSR